MSPATRGHTEQRSLVPAKAQEAVLPWSPAGPGVPVLRVVCSTLHDHCGTALQSSMVQQQVQPAGAGLVGSQVPSMAGRCQEGDVATRPWGWQWCGRDYQEVKQRLIKLDLGGD